MKHLTALLLLLLALTARHGHGTLRAAVRADYDVYLLIGQSNMAGRGPMVTTDTLDAIPGVYLLNGEGKPEPATAPLNRYSTIRKDLGLQEAGPGLSFGEKMHRLTGRKILLVQNARGGSSIRSWLPGATDGYLDSALVRTRQALRYGTLRGICWHQGETDTPQSGLAGQALDSLWEPGTTPQAPPTATARGAMTPAAYVEAFTRMAAELRRQLGDVPIVVGEVGQWGWTSARDITLFNDSTLTRVCRTVHDVAKVSSDGLQRRWKDKPRDPHFSRDAALELGRRYAEAMVRCLPPAALPVRIAQYRDGKQAAITFTYDDGMGEHYSMVAPELEKRGFRGTFWVIGNKVGAREDYDNRLTWEQCREMSDRGHEISSHSWSHPNLTRMADRDSLMREILMNDSAIEAATGRRPVTFCYPYNAYNDLVLRLTRNGRVGTRTRQVGHGEQNNKVTPARLTAWLRDQIEQHEWGVTMTHGITHGYDRWYHPEWLWNFYDEVKAAADTVWVGTFAEVAAYVAEREAVRLRIHKNYRSKIILYPHLHLDERLFNQPLTLEVHGDWTGRKVTARQGRSPLEVVNRGDRLLINFDPAGRRIKIDW